MSASKLRAWLLDGLLPVVFLVTLYGVFTMRTWSVDGCIMTGATDHFMDLRSYGHFLLRPTAYLWAALGRALGLTEPGQTYQWLRLLFSAFGVVALAVMFPLAVRRSGSRLSAWLVLVAIAVSRNALRHFATLDEKGLGLCLMALALAATAALFARLDRGLDGRPVGGLFWLTCTLWVLAAFGHLQTLPYAMAFFAGLLFYLPLPMSRAQRCGLAALALLYMALLSVVIFSAVHFQLGGLRAFGDFLGRLFSGSPTPEPGSLRALLSGTMEGYIKAFFGVDRFTPRPFLGLAVAGFGLLAAAVLWGFFRLRDSLAVMLLGGGVLHMALMPLANAFPNYGDSYTTLILAAFVLMATAPRGLLAAVAVLSVTVNLPIQARLSWTSLTMRQHLETMGRVQAEDGGEPWVVVDELARMTEPGNEQEFAPIYYPMLPTLAYEQTPLADLPPERCLVEVPLLVERDGQVNPAREQAIGQMLRSTGREATMKSLYAQPRILPSDHRAYGAYFILGAAPGAPDAPEAPEMASPVGLPSVPRPNPSPSADPPAGPGAAGASIPPAPAQ